MSFSFSLVREGKLGPEEAKACLMANMGLPGAGSLMAGRRAGYGQALIALVGMGLTFGFGLMFAIWFFRNMQELRAPEADPFVTLAELWRQVRWALAGVAFFVFAWVWALATSLNILQGSRRS